MKADLLLYSMGALVEDEGVAAIGGADEQREVCTPLAVSRDPGMSGDRHVHGYVVYMDIMHKASARGRIAGGVSVLWYAARISSGWGFLEFTLGLVGAVVHGRSRGRRPGPFESTSACVHVLFHIFSTRTNSRPMSLLTCSQR